MAIGPILKEARLKKQLTESQVAEMTRMKIQIVQDLEKDDFHRIAATIYGKGFIKLFAECVGLDPAPLIADYLRSVAGDNPSLITKGVDNPGEISRPKPLPPPGTEKQADPAPGMPDFDFNEPAVEATQQEAEAEDDLFAYTRKKNTIEDESVIPPAEEPPADASENSTETVLKRIAAYITDAAEAARSYTLNLLNKLADIQWGDAPVKIVSIIIGSMIIILVLTISLKSCGRNHGAAPVTDDSTLRTVIPPPEPYFD